MKGIPKANYKLHDSGRRAEFSTGAVRDTAEGKGRYDLISPVFLARLAVLMEKGAKKYGARNWEKGMSMSRFLDSAFRHLHQWQRGSDLKEDHLAAAAFNVMGLIHTELGVEEGRLPAELADIPGHEVPTGSGGQASAGGPPPCGLREACSVAGEGCLAPPNGTHCGLIISCYCCGRRTCLSCSDKVTTSTGNRLCLTCKRLSR